MKITGVLFFLLMIAIVFAGIFKASNIGVPTENAVTQSSSETVTVIESQVKVPDSEIVGEIIEKDLQASGKVDELGEIVINNQTGVAIDSTEYFYKPLSFSLEKNDEPQVLIMHTHTTESYMLHGENYYTESDAERTTDTEKNVAAVGKVMAEQIERAGFSVIHDTTLHDHPGYTGSYSRSAETVKNYLKKYPSIKIVIDLHRDSISANDNKKIAPVIEINGKKAAQIMIVMGSNTGNITNHPNWRENLSLAVKVQNTINIMYPGLSRAILIKSSRYNQNLSNGSFLIEVGSEANTLDEALYSGELIGKAVAVFLELNTKG